MEREVLPANPKPKSYGLVITPNFTDFTLRGEVTVNLVSSAAFDRIECNALEIVVESATVTADGFSQAFTKDQVAIDTKKERVAFALSKAIDAKEAQIVIQYTGVMNDKMCGFYRSKFTHNGETKYLGTTQFEAVDARQALPCWDEPAMKATFRVTLVVPSDLVALSNTAEKSSTPVDGGLKRVEFEETPIMSTYLLAWTIGEMKCIEKTVAKTRGGETLVRVFATAGKEEQGRFALDLSCKILPLYEEFFGSDYVLSKLDLLAIPDFAAGAMENWGLITYRETALLATDKSSALTKEWVALVVAHEIAHMWFGNRVTMEWWKQLWLNESFATWVMYWAVDHFYPEWQVWTQFVNDRTATQALVLDGLLSSHPVEVDLSVAREIDGIFDAISYSKGGSVLRMVVEFIGIDAFQKGVAKYLATFSFSNATTNDLWKYLGEAAGKDLNAVLDAWILQQGYPMVEVKRDGGSIVASQRRFLSSGPEESGKHDTTVWNIPLFMRVEGQEKEVQVMLSEKSASFAVPAGRWTKVNLREAAFCRVKYADDMLPPLKEAIATQSISNTDRLALVFDYHAFASSGFASTVDALELLSAFENETDFTVWCAILNLDDDVRSLLSTRGDDAVAKLNAFTQKLCTGPAAKIGFTPQPGDDHRIAQLRGRLLARLAATGDDAAIAAANDAFAARQTNEISADLRAAVYGAVAVRGGEAEWNVFRDMYENEGDAAERSRALGAMSAFKDLDLLKKTLDFMISDKVRPQDSLYVVRGATSNGKAAHVYVQHLITHSDEYFKRFPGMIIGRLVKAVEAFSDTSILVDLEKWMQGLDEKNKATVDRSYAQGVEAVRVKAKWLERDAEAIEKFLSKQ